MGHSQISVRSFCPGALTAEHQAVLATLPASFGVVMEGAADVAIVDADASSIEAGLATKPRLAVLAEPSSITQASLNQLLQAGIPVLPVLRHWHVLKRNWPTTPLVDGKLVRSTFFTNRDADTALLEQLAALEGMLGPLTDTAVLSRGWGSYFGSARSSGNVPVLWSAQGAAGFESFEFDHIGLAERLEIKGTAGDVAKPAQTSHGTRAGLKQLRWIHQSGLRLFWKSVAEELSGAAVTAKLGEIAHLIALVRQVGIDEIAQGKEIA
jgi:hypothetical protein